MDSRMYRNKDFMALREKYLELKQESFQTKQYIIRLQEMYKYQTLPEAKQQIIQTLITLREARKITHKDLAAQTKLIDKFKTEFYKSKNKRYRKLEL